MALIPMHEVLSVTAKTSRKKNNGEANKELRDFD